MSNSFDVLQRYLGYIERSIAGCRRALSRFKVGLQLSLGIRDVCISRNELATARRNLERRLRDSGVSRSEAKRISGKSLDNFITYD